MPVVVGSKLHPGVSFVKYYHSFSRFAAGVFLGLLDHIGPLLAMENGCLAGAWFGVEANPFILRDDLQPSIFLPANYPKRELSISTSA